MTEYPLPRAWKSLPLADLAALEPNSITDGPFGSKLKTEHYTDTGPRVVRLQNIGDGVFCDERAHISEAHFATLRKHRVFDGDLVIAALGETLPRACIVPPTLGPAIVKADCIRFKPNTDVVSNKYLLYALISPQVRHAAATIIHGVGRPRLNQSEIKSLPVPLAPRAEQDRIVAEIEKQFTRLDAGVEALSRLQAHLRRYRAALLKAACEGRLVPTEAELARQDGRPFESGESLRQRLRGMRASSKSPVPADLTDAPHVPEGWVLASMDELALHITSGSRDWSRYYGTGTGTFIMAQNVRPGRLDLSFRQAVDPPADDRDRARSAVHAGDLLVTIVGANTGDVCRVPRELPEHFVCQSVALLRPADAGIAQFLSAYMNSSEHGQRQYKRYIYGQGRPHLSFDQLRATPVLLPPLPEQARIVAALEARFSEIDSVNQTIEHAGARAARLRSTILRAAFEGRLLPQRRFVRAAPTAPSAVLAQLDSTPRPTPRPRFRKKPASA